jgi:hypothetical protein
MPSHGNTINYQPSQPSHPWSGRTTEFDDALLQRGIVTPHQVFMAKGASELEADRLAGLWQQQQQQQQANTNSRQETDNSIDVDVGVAAAAVAYDDEDEDEDISIHVDDDDDDDIQFLQQYRQKRIQEMQQQQSQQQQQQQQQQPILRHITRNEWMTHVNQASMEQHQWVIVTLTDQFCHDRVTQELHQLQRQQQQQQQQQLSSQPLQSSNHAIVNWVTISATDAISNWPAERVPTLFAYRDGIKQHEWIASYAGQWPASLLQLLQEEWRIV